MILGVVLIVCVACGVIAASIANAKGLSAGAYFVAGLLLGVIGIVIAAVVRPAPSRDPAMLVGWYPDPWEQSTYRWFDGAQWTGHVT